MQSPVFVVRRLGDDRHVVDTRKSQLTRLPLRICFPLFHMQIESKFTFVCDLTNIDGTAAGNAHFLLADAAIWCVKLQSVSSTIA